MAFFKRGSGEKRRQKEGPPWCYSITTTIHYPGCTDEEVRESRKQLHEDLKSCRKRDLEDQRGSMEEAKKLYR